LGKKKAALSTAQRPTLFQARLYKPGHAGKPLQESIGIQAVKHVPAFLATGQYAHFMHQVEMTRYHGSMLRHVFRDRCNVGPAVQKEEPDDLHPDRLSQGLEKFGVQNGNQFIGNLSLFFCV